MLGNRALQAGVTNVTGGAGGRTLGYNVTAGNIYPCDLLTVSTSGTATITLPSIAVPQYGGLGIGDAQQIRVLNLAAQTVTLAAASGDTIVGAYASASITTANTCATLISKATSATAGTWYSF